MVASHLVPHLTGHINDMEKLTTSDEVLLVRFGNTILHTLSAKYSHVTFVSHTEWPVPQTRCHVTGLKQKCHQVSVLAVPKATENNLDDSLSRV